MTKKWRELQKSGSLTSYHDYIRIWVDFLERGGVGGGAWE